MSDWDDQPLRVELVRQVGEQLGREDGVLVFDPSGFARSGKESVGVARQWCGRLGKVDNCQVAVYMGYVSAEEHALVDMRLYLPKEWTQDKARREKAGVPRWVRFRTRHQLCLEMLEQHRGKLPHSWIAGDDEWAVPTHFAGVCTTWANVTCWPSPRTLRFVIWKATRLLTRDRAAPHSALGSA
jgi:SRSO17 transposase